jgi:hypothetical protein
MRRLRNVRSAELLAFGAIVVFAVCVADAQVYDAAAQFDPANNPSGPWSYGGREGADSTAFTPLTPYAYPGAPAGMCFWASDWPGGNFGGIAKNMTDTTLVYGYYNNVITPPGAMTMAPGPGTRGSVLRWTAPAAGVYSISADFLGTDTQGTTSDVHVEFNGTSLYSDYINGYQDGKSYSGVANINAGDILDVFVGNGVNGNEISDTTRVAFTITVVPEPSTIVLLSVGVISLIAYVWRRQAG